MQKVQGTLQTLPAVAMSLRAPGPLREQLDARLHAKHSWQFSGWTLDALLQLPNITTSLVYNRLAAYVYGWYLWRNPCINEESPLYSRS